MGDGNGCSDEAAVVVVLSAGNRTGPALPESTGAGDGDGDGDRDRDDGRDSASDVL